MKLVLTHAYYLKEDARERVIMKPYPPLGILSISAWLDKFSVDHEVYDSTFSDHNSQQQYLLKTRPDIIGIYSNLMSKKAIADLISFIRKEHDLSHAMIILGGPDVTYNIENYLKLGADILVIGEGEETMLELSKVSSGKSNAQLQHIDGIAFLDDRGDIIRTRPRAKMPDLDVLPTPARGKIDMSLYMDTWKNYHGKSAISLSTQRGCPYTCKWCSTAVYGQSYRRRSPAAVVDEMEMIQRQYQPDQLWFVDDVFTVSHKWLIEFQSELNTRKIHIPFECITRADRLTEDVIKVLKDAGCFRVWIGAESGSQKILDAMDRRVQATQVEEMIIYAKTLGVETGTFIMLGYPGETEEDIFLTLEYLKRANPDHFTITVAYPIKGTALYDETASSHILKKPWQESTDRDIEFKRTYPREYYRFAVPYIVQSVLQHRRSSSSGSRGYNSLKHRLKIFVCRLGMLWYRNKALHFS